MGFAAGGSRPTADLFGASKRIIGHGSVRKGLMR